ncbi:class I lanthipeptide [Taibaiella koreensis]|uniref:class I lanthipeptide n=1 Tax=Taibaiella koreensis TaxID=1268548 RepID=UPI0013C30688|nr:class I lanthipeptide [Taibaiella koreensis]
MKKKPNAGKISLNKSTVLSMSKSNSEKVQGGATVTCFAPSHRAMTQVVRQGGCVCSCAPC